MQPKVEVSQRPRRLRHVTDAKPGIRRVRRGRGFIYLRPDGRRVRSRRELGRIRSLAIPPAWKDVWICPRPNGHLQATGRDARGRKQHRYHPVWSACRDATKFDRLAQFGKVLPRLRRRVARDLCRPGLPREKVLATVVKLLQVSFIRVGNSEYARQNDSFGLTTMRSRHVDVNGSRFRFTFRGKSGVKHSVDLSDPRLAKIIRRCQSLPGQELFQYLDDHGRVRSVHSTDVNDYLRRITRHDFTSKDFRTWSGTILAARELNAMKPPTSPADAKRNITRAIELVAQSLGNTRTVCRKSYVHPVVIDAYLNGSLSDAFQKGSSGATASSQRAIRQEEAAVLTLLRRRATRSCSSRG